ncbi:hypothetical protein DIS24_g4673 [Lasiodiplodia hormozganensis]|uniref:Spherulin-4 n=1 Tax=Lasiodiplodia hormozganensis TaxID=869390 RepID=A0AA39YU23_9PEZI|nr:hypothetical protein DIS24_g4673 [Lasiodiplodia hormozganensis]
MLRRAFGLLALGAQLVQAQVNVAAAALVPAYIWPETETTWQPLYDQIEGHASVQFTIIINPGSGPGPNSLPDAAYQREILKLHDYDNVRLVGYVAVNWTNKAQSTVEAEVAKYAGWPSASGNAALSVDGIFFDEAPTDNDSAKITFMQSVTTYTRSFANAGLSASPYVVTNPGVPPARAYLYNANDDSLVPDLSLVYEEAYSTWTTDQDTVRDRIWGLDVDNGSLAVMLHDVPATIACADLSALVDEFKGNVGVNTLWFTNDSDYQVWPDATLWNEYLSAFASGGSAC